MKDVLKIPEVAESHLLLGKADVLAVLHFEKEVLPSVSERAARIVTEKIAKMALERGLTVNSPLEPQRRTGWIGIDFEGSEQACRRLIERRVFVDYRPGCGIRVGPHFYTADEEIDEFFRVLQAVSK